MVLNLFFYIVSIITLTFALTHLLFISSFSNDIDYAVAYSGIGIIYFSLFIFLLCCKTEITFIGTSFVVISASLFMF